MSGFESFLELKEQYAAEVAKVEQVSADSASSAAAVANSVLNKAPLGTCALMTVLVGPSGSGASSLVFIS